MIVLNSSVIVLMMMIVSWVVGVRLYSGFDCIIKYILVVIMVVVWISVEIGVGFFIVLLS